MNTEAIENRNKADRRRRMAFLIAVQKFSDLIASRMLV